MVVPLLCYHFTALCTSKGDISASAICYLLEVFQIIIIQAGFHRLLLLLRWPFLQPLVFSALFAAICFQPTTLRQLTVGMIIFSYCLRYSFKSLQITFVVDWAHLNVCILPLQPPFLPNDQSKCNWLREASTAMHASMQQFMNKKIPLIQS